MSKTADMIRAHASRGDDRRDAGCTTPEDIRRLDNIPYGPDQTWNLLDLYLPKQAQGPLPVVVSVHGGAWVYGDKDRYQFYCMSLAQQGFAVVNYTYRLAPEHKFPAPVEDTCAVFRWVLRNGKAYGLDCANLFAVGDSAGAHILAMYCCACASPHYARQLKVVSPEKGLPKAVALNCGIYRIDAGNRDSFAGELMEDYLPEKGTPQELEWMDIPAHLTAAFPPAFVMTCQGDFLAAQSKPLVERLQKLGVPVQYHYYGGPDLTLEHVFHLKIRTEIARQCNRDECRFFQGHCAPCED